MWKFAFDGSQEALPGTSAEAWCPPEVPAASASVASALCGFHPHSLLFLPSTEIGEAILPAVNATLPVHVSLSTML